MFSSVIFLIEICFKKKLIVCTICKILSLAEGRGLPFPMFKAKALTLETTISKYVIPGILRVLQNSPELKKLTLHTMDREARTMSFHFEFVESEILTICFYINEILFCSSTG